MYLFAERSSSSFVILRRSRNSGITFRNISIAELMRFTRRRSLSFALSRFTFSVAASTVCLEMSYVVSAGVAADLLSDWKLSRSSYVVSESELD